MVRASRSRIENVGNIHQVWNQDTLKGDYEAWENTWNNGANWGIIGIEDTPKTVLGQLKEHGRARFARSPPEGIQYGFGNLMFEVEEMVNKDIIIIKDLEKLEEIIKTIQEILGNKRLNPANIRFSNVVIKFTLPKGDGEPKIIRKKKWYGHYRTPAFNKYMKWRHSVGEGEGQLRIPDADREWSSAQQDSANPPMLQAVNSLLKIAQETLESAGNAELPDGEPLAIRILDIHTGPDGGLHQISSIQDFATEIVNDPAMYAGGASTSRRIILLRLRKKFEEQIFEVGANESEYLNFIPGFTNIIGTDEGFTMKLSFPPSAGALKSLMKNIPGLDLSTITRPAAEGASPEIIERYREGVIIKSLEQINKMTKLLPKLKRENNG